MANPSKFFSAALDAPAVSFPSGNTATMRYWRRVVGERPNEDESDPRILGLHKFHETTAPNVLSKILRQYGNEEPLVKQYGPPTQGMSRYGEKTNTYVSPDWWAPLSPELKRRLREKGKVRFFKKGGKV